MGHGREYSGILAEHMATRTGAGLFDVSHMGEIEVRETRLDLVQHVTCNDAARLALGRRTIPGFDDEQEPFLRIARANKISGTHYFLCVNRG